MFNQLRSAIECKTKLIRMEETFVTEYGKCIGEADKAYIVVRRKYTHPKYYCEVVEVSSKLTTIHVIEDNKINTSFCADDSYFPDKRFYMQEIIDELGYKP